MKLSHRWVALFLFVTFAAGPLQAANGAVTSKPPDRIVLLVDEIGQIRNVAVVLAEQLGYLQDGGHVVTVMNVRNDVATADMLADGRVDAVMAYYHHTIVNQAAGREFAAIVTLGVTPGAKLMIANQVRDKYRSGADLKGSRIVAGGAGSSKTTLANALLLAGGHSIGDYTRIVNESKELIAAALRQGAADLVVAPTPDGDFYESQGVASVFADLTTTSGTRALLGDLFPTATVYMTSACAASRPDIAQHLATAFVRTLQWMNSHSAEEIAARIPLNISGRDRDAYLRVLKQELPMFATDGRMPESGAEKEWQVLSAANPDYRSVKLQKTYTNQFVDAALRMMSAR